MRAVIQRISNGSVTVDGEVVGVASKGLMALVGFGQGDVTDDRGKSYIIDKLLNLRIFQDDGGKMNLSVQDIEGDLLIVPNFTLYGDCRKGRRPGFSDSAPVSSAELLFIDFVKEMKARYPKVECGVFQAEMTVDITNDGPVTLILDSDKIL